MAAAWPESIASKEAIPPAASWRTWGSVALHRARLDVRLTAPGMFVTP